MLHVKQTVIYCLIRITALNSFTIVCHYLSLIINRLNAVNVDISGTYI